MACRRTGVVSRLLLIFVLAAAAVDRGAFAEDPAVAPAAERENWRGTVELPGGKSLDFFVSFAGDAGKISIPMQGVQDLALTSVSRADEKMAFSIVPPGAPEEAGARFEFTKGAEGRSATGFLHQAGMQFPVKLSLMAAGEETGPRRPQTPKAPFPYAEREVRFTSGAGSITLAGTLTVPKEGGPHPAVVMITGSGAQDRNESILGHQPFYVIADHLSRNGFAVLRLDDRGVGGSTGNLVDTTSEESAGDVVAAIDFLKKQPGVDPVRIGLIGHSEGGSIGPLVASMSDQVKFVVMLAGMGLPGKDIMRIQSVAILRGAGATDEERLKAVETAHTAMTDAVIARAPADEVKSKLTALAATQFKAAGEPAPEAERLNQLAEGEYAGITSAWMRSFLTLDPAAALRRVKVPVLALFGERDQQVPAKDNMPAVEAALKEGGNPDFTVKEMPGLNHLFQDSETGSLDEYALIEETISPVALDTITEWLRKKAGLN